MRLKRVFSSLKLLFLNPYYLLLALILSFVLFVAYFVLNDTRLYQSALSISSSPSFLWEVFVNHISAVAEVSGAINVVAVSLVAVLGGVNLSLTAFRVRKTKVFVGRASLPGFLGTFGGAFAASCSACSTALISLLGLTGGLAVLPLGGLEISLLAIALLVFSLHLVSKSFVEFGLVKSDD